MRAAPWWRGPQVIGRMGINRRLLRKTWMAPLTGFIWRCPRSPLERHQVHIFVIRLSYEDIVHLSRLVDWSISLHGVLWQSACIENVLGCWEQAYCWYFRFSTFTCIQWKTAKKVCDRKSHPVCGTIWPFSHGCHIHRWLSDTELKPLLLYAFSLWCIEMANEMNRQRK